MPKENRGKKRAARDVTTPVSSPISHVVIIVKENHAFDNYFGTFPGANGVQLPQAPDPIEDPKHNHEAWLRRKDPSGAVQFQYTQNDIPSYWALAPIGQVAAPNLGGFCYRFLVYTDQPGHQDPVAAGAGEGERTLVYFGSVANPCQFMGARRDSAFRVSLEKATGIGIETRIPSTDSKFFFPPEI